MIPTPGIDIIRSPDNKMKTISIFPMQAIINNNNLQVVKMKVAKQTPLLIINVHNTNFKKKHLLIEDINHHVNAFLPQNVVIGGDFNMEEPTIEKLTKI